MAKPLATLLIGLCLVAAVLMALAKAWLDKVFARAETMRASRPRSQ